MLNRNFSLLFSRESANYSKVDISDDVICDLGLDRLIPLKNSNLSEYFTSDKQTIEYRQAVISDLMKHPEICGVLNTVHKLLSDISELRRIKSEMEVAKNYLYSITEIELYIDIVGRLAKVMLPIDGSLESDGLKAFAAEVRLLSDSDYYKDLNRRLSELTSKVHEVKSITIGVNLDERFRPTEAGVISLNSDSFKSGRVIDKILRMDFKDDDYTCIAPLVPYSREHDDNAKIAFTNAFNNAMNDIYKADVRAWRGIVETYVLSNTDFLLSVMPEIEFLTKSVDLLTRLNNKGLKFCIPEITGTELRALKLEKLYNPDVALRVDDEMVTNDIDFDDKAKIYILTGPNRGGKSVITCAVGQAVALAQLGIPVPCESAVLSPVSGIFTHFPGEADATLEKGRLGEECQRLADIFARLDKNSLVLLDESFSSTGAYEASSIASEVIGGFSMIGCRVLFSTHLHELSARIDELNNTYASMGGAPIDNLVAGIDGGKRSFKITRAKPDGKSYARDIADKYGLSLDKILEIAKNKNT